MIQPVDHLAWFEVSILGAQVCVHDITAWIYSEFGTSAKGQGRWLACMNPHSYVVSINDRTFSLVLRSADWLIPDGIGIVLASKILGGRIRKRVTGSDIFSGLHKELDKKGGSSVFFLGSTRETLAAIRRRMAEDYPGIRVAGTYSPPFRPEFEPEETERIIQTINDVSPDVLWVGMTAPKQEKWIHRNKGELNVKFIGAVGAVFDFYAGNIKRAPAIVQKIGLEWLYRWIREPRRLWRRNLISTPMFLAMVLKERFKKNSASRIARLGR